MLFVLEFVVNENALLDKLTGKGLGYTNQDVHIFKKTIKISVMQFNVGRHDCLQAHKNVR